MTRTVIIRKTLQGAMNFIERLIADTVRPSALVQAGAGIRASLNMNVLVDDLDSIYAINDRHEMRSLIASGGPPRRGTYNDAYRAFKKRHGLPPHVLTGTMTRNIFVDVMFDRVLFYIPDSGINQSLHTSTTRMRYARTTRQWHYFNFGPIHERRKSILKATIVFGWADILTRVTEAYERVARIS